MREINDSNECLQTVTGKGVSVYSKLRYPCGKKVKFAVKYRSPVNGDMVTNKLCATHKNGLVNWAEKLNKKTGFDVMLKVEEIYLSPTLNNCVK